MICSKCKKQNDENANFCRFCGSKLIKTDPNEASSEKETVEVLPASQGKRFTNLILDYVGILVFAVAIGFLSEIVGLYSLIENTNETLFSIVIMVFYYILFEAIWSKTPAKFITKTKVVMENGEKPEFWDIVVRTLIRFIPFEAFSFLGSKEKSQNPLGWHDKWSKTVVINDK